MQPLIVSLLIAAAFLHACWNAVLRVGADRLWSITVMSLLSALVALPFVFALPPPDRASWGCIALSATLQIVYCFALVRAYRDAGLAQAYPVARGMAPLLVIARVLHAVGMAGKQPNLLRAAGTVGTTVVTAVYVVCGLMQVFAH